MPVCAHTQMLSAEAFEAWKSSPTATATLGELVRSALTAFASVGIVNPSDDIPSFDSALAAPATVPALCALSTELCSRVQAGGERNAELSAACCESFEMLLAAIQSVRDIVDTHCKDLPIAYQAAVCDGGAASGASPSVASDRDAAGLLPRFAGYCNKTLRSVGQAFEARSKKAFGQTRNVAGAQKTGSRPCNARSGQGGEVRV